MPGTVLCAPENNSKTERNSWLLFHGTYVPEVRERDSKQANKEIKQFQTVIGAVKKIKQNEEIENTGAEPGEGNPSLGGRKAL